METQLNDADYAYLDLLAEAGDRLKRAALNMRELGWTNETQQALNVVLGGVSLAESQLVAAGVLDNDGIQLARDVAYAEQAYF
jgi:hypothetical protein